MAVFIPILAAAAPHIVRNVLISLGIGVVTYAGLSTLVASVASSVSSNYASVGGSALAILNMLGAGQAIGIILGALSARAAYAAVSRLGSLI